MLDAKIDELAAVLAKAQSCDGYLNTRYGTARYTDLEWGHELYCYGHLIQAGVARLRCHGEDLLVEVARRAADHVCAEFGPDGRQDICGHPEIETALVELYRATGERRYLDQAKLFVERRGHGRLADIEFGRAYYQDDVPVRDRRVFSGHAVREFYFACGAVDVAVETGDEELLGAIVRQWERTVAARTYVTGATGSRHAGESFGVDFELPPDRAYGETCAAIGSVMLSWRLLLATGEARFADLIERTLFNAVAVSPSLDGRSFFYSNPLQVREPGERPDLDRPLPRSSAGLRASWFDVACCPPNLARLMASLGTYQATTDPNGVQLHQLWPGSLSTSVRPDRDRDRLSLVRSGHHPRRVGGRRAVAAVDPGAGVGAAAPGCRDDRSSPATRWSIAGGHRRTGSRWNCRWRPGGSGPTRGSMPSAAAWRWSVGRWSTAPSRRRSRSTRPGRWRRSRSQESGRRRRRARRAGFRGRACRRRSGRTGASGPPARTPRPTACCIPYHLWGNRGPTGMRVFLPVDRDGRG